MKNHSPPHPHAEQFSEQKGGGGGGGEMMVTEKRLCDFCGERRALLYCRPDSAKLCFSCDREVHSTNQLFTKHARSLLCDSCDSFPSSILCSTENLVLCQNCDWEKHNRPFSAVHDRRPLEGFSGCPSANDLSSILGFDEGLGDKALFPSNNGEMVDLFSDFLVWDTPSIVTLDDLIVPADSEHNFQAMGVPPLPKNRKAICGQQKDEMLRQLHELSRLEPGLNYSNEDVELLNGFPSVVPKQNLQPRNVNAGREHDAEATPCPSFGAHAFQWCSNSGEAANEVVPSSFLRSYIEETPKDGVKHSERSHMEETPKDGVKHSERSYIEETPKDGVKHSEIGGNLSLAHVSASHEGQSQDLNPITTGILPVLPRVPSHELTAQERETAISRYKEKRKTRRY